MAALSEKEIAIRNVIARRCEIIREKILPNVEEKTLAEHYAGQVNTCWTLSPDEIKKVQETGQIYVSLLTFGQPLQPVLVSVDKPDVYDPE